MTNTEAGESESAPKIPLHILVDELHRELTDRYRRYSGKVKRGEMTEAESAAGIARMRAARNVLRWVEAHEAEFREFDQKRKEAKQADAQKDEIDKLLETDAGARAVSDAFPNSKKLLNESKPLEFTGQEFMGSGSTDEGDVFPPDRRAVEGPTP